MKHDSMSQYCPNCEAQAAEIERLREALERIARNEVEVFDEDEGCDVWVSMDEGELSDIARAALAGKAEQ